MATHVQRGWVLSLQLAFGFLSCSGGCSVSTSCGFISLALWLLWLQGLLCLCWLLSLTHFGRSWMKDVGRWLPLCDILSGDKGVGWLVLQMEFRLLIAYTGKVCYGKSLQLCFWLSPSRDVLVLRVGGHGESCPGICATSLHFPVVFWILQGLSSEQTGVLVTNQHGQWLV